MSKTSYAQKRYPRFSFAFFEKTCLNTMASHRKPPKEGPLEHKHPPARFFRRFHSLRERSCSAYKQRLERIPVDERARLVRALKLHLNEPLQERARPAHSPPQASQLVAPKHRSRSLRNDAFLIHPVRICASKIAPFIFLIALCSPTFFFLHEILCLFSNI